MIVSKMFLMLSAMVALPQDTDQAQSNDDAASAQVATEETEKADSSRRIKIGKRFYEPDDMVCKRERVTGSRVKKRICNTARQWALIEENTRALTDEMRSGVNSVNNNPGG